MAHGRDRDQWTRLSVLLAVLVNLQRDPDKEPIKPGQMNIYDTRGELKKPIKKRKPKLSQMLQASGAKHKPQGEKNGPDTQSDEPDRPQ